MRGEEDLLLSLSEPNGGSSAIGDTVGLLETKGPTLRLGPIGSEPEKNRTCEKSRPLSTSSSSKTFKKIKI